MKQLLLAIALTAITLNVGAQADSANKKMMPADIHHVDDGKPQNHNLIVNPDMGTQNNPDPVTGKPVPATQGADGYMFQDGKMMVITNGKLETLQADTKLSNGTLVMTNGLFITKDGSKVKLKEGQLLDLNGEVIPRK